MEPEGEGPDQVDDGDFERVITAEMRRILVEQGREDLVPLVSEAAFDEFSESSEPEIVGAYSQAMESDDCLSILDVIDLLRNNGHAGSVIGLHDRTLAQIEASDDPHVAEAAAEVRQENDAYEQKTRADLHKALIAQGHNALAGELGSMPFSEIETSDDPYILAAYRSFYEADAPSKGIGRRGWRSIVLLAAVVLVVFGFFYVKSERAEDALGKPVFVSDGKAYSIEDPPTPELPQLEQFAVDAATMLFRSDPAKLCTTERLVIGNTPECGEVTGSTRFKERLAELSATTAPDEPVVRLNPQLVDKVSLVSAKFGGGIAVVVLNLKPTGGKATQLQVDVAVYKREDKAIVFDIDDVRCGARPEESAYVIDSYKKCVFERS